MKKAFALAALERKPQLYRTTRGKRIDRAGGGSYAIYEKLGALVLVFKE